MKILGFDPGQDKCGVAVMESDRTVVYHAVIPAAEALMQVQHLCKKYTVQLVVIGDRTTSKQWRSHLAQQLSPSIPIAAVDEHNSTLEARDHYWQMYPPQGLKALIPQDLRLPPRPIDDIVAILLVERYLTMKSIGS